MSRLGEYLKETKAELKHVNWPTKNQAILFTTIIVVFSLVVASFLGAFDLLFLKIVQMFI